MQFKLTAPTNDFLNHVDIKFDDLRRPSIKPTLQRAAMLKPVFKHSTLSVRQLSQSALFRPTPMHEEPNQSYKVTNCMPPNGLKSYKSHRSKTSISSETLTPTLDYMKRFSKEAVTKCMNEKDARVIYTRDEGMQGSKRIGSLRFRQKDSCRFPSVSSQSSTESRERAAQ